MISKRILRDSNRPNGHSSINLLVTRTHPLIGRVTRFFKIDANVFYDADIVDRRGDIERRYL